MTDHSSAAKWESKQPHQSLAMASIAVRGRQTGDGEVLLITRRHCRPFSLSDPSPPSLSLSLVESSYSTGLRIMPVLEICITLDGTDTFYERSKVRR